MTESEHGDTALLDAFAETPPEGTAKDHQRFSAKVKMQVVEDVHAMDEQRLKESCAELKVEPDRIKGWVELYKRGGRRELRVGGPGLDTEVAEAIGHLETLIRKRILEDLTQSK